MTPTDNEFITLRKMIHEIRNPLTAASCTLQLLETKYPKLHNEKYFKSLANDLDYMIALLANFSDFTSKRKLQVESFCLDALIKEVALSFATQLVDEKVTFSSKIELDDVSFTGDPIQIQQLLRNLLKNAFQACEENDSIYLHTYAKDHTVVISIKDTGCGISKEQLPTIFEPFVTYTKKHGSGIGLPICKQIVESHHGTIQVESILDEGTTFRILLPTDYDGNQKTGN